MRWVPLYALLSPVPLLSLSKAFHWYFSDRVEWGEEIDVFFLKLFLSLCPFFMRVLFEEESQGRVREGGVPLRAD